MQVNFIKKVFYSVGIFALIIFCIGIFLNYNKETKKELIIDKPNIKLAFVGDIMLDRGVKASVYKNFNGDYGELFAKVSAELKSYDFLFGNLEGPVSDKGVDGGNIYSFRMEPVVLPALKEAGFDGFSIDNNHILNYGLEALVDTKIRLNESGLIMGGDNFNISGVKINILTFNEFANLDLEQIKKDIIEMKINNDLVIAYFHFGEEYAPEPNEYQKIVAKLAIDSGADLVIGAHPHVIQPLEQYKGKYIMYSLGNFIFDQNFSSETMEGGLLEVEVNPNTKLIEKATLKKVLLNSKFQIESIK
jgi:poly-gamma-glutamate synthesis protein (capsule biosynthesis protein)